MDILKHQTSLRISPECLFYLRITNNWCCCWDLHKKNSLFFKHVEEFSITERWRNEEATQKLSCVSAELLQESQTHNVGAMTPASVFHLLLLQSQDPARREEQQDLPDPAVGCSQLCPRESRAASAVLGQRHYGSYLGLDLKMIRVKIRKAVESASGQVLGWAEAFPQVQERRKSQGRYKNCVLWVSDCWMSSCTGHCSR